MEEPAIRKGWVFMGKNKHGLLKFRKTFEKLIKGPNLQYQNNVKATYLIRKKKFSPLCIVVREIPHNDSL